MILCAIHKLKAKPADSTSTSGRCPVWPMNLTTLAQFTTKDLLYPLGRRIRCFHQLACNETRYQPTAQEQAQRKKEALADRVEKLSRVRVLEAIRKKLPDALSRLDLEMVALDYFRRLGHDNHRRLSKLY
jgi:hypothetical protein